VMEAHFYSDILAGAVIGWSVAWFVTKACMDFFDRHHDLARLELVFGRKRIRIAGSQPSESPPSAPA